MSEKPNTLPEQPDEDATRATDTGSTRGMVPSELPTPKPRPADPGGTQRTESIPPHQARSSTPHAERVPPQERPNPPMPNRQLPPRPTGAARARRDNGFYLPLWSLALMLVVVVMLAGGIVLVVISLGGRGPSSQAPQSAPVVIVSSPVPTQRPDSFPAVPATATIPPAVDPNQNAADSAPLVLSGPTLEPVVFTPTPRNITVGDTVIVIDVGAQQLNIRDEPGVIGTEVVFRATEGSQFTIVEGPQQADGLTWWRIQSSDNATLDGWAASNYLEIPALP